MRPAANAGSRLKRWWALGRPCLTCQPSSRTGENPPYGMIGGTVETSASFEARYAPLSYPTEGRECRSGHGRPKRARSWKRRTQPRKAYSLSGLLYSERWGFFVSNRFRVDARHKVRTAMQRASAIYPDVRAVAAFGAGAVSCEEATSRELSRGLPANILLILRPRSASVKGFWMSDTPGINISARRNSPL
jgi:hypothetical protein